MMVQTGMSTAFPPNTPAIMVSGPISVDVDFTEHSFGDKRPTNLSCAGTVTAHSFHTGIANMLLMDGTVRSASNQTDLKIWRAFGTRAGGEVVGEF